MRLAMTLLPLAVLLASTNGSSAESNANRQASADVIVPGEPSLEDAKVPPVISVGDGVRRFSVLPTLEFGGLCAWMQVSILQPPEHAYNESGGIPDHDCAIEVKTIKPFVVVSGSSDLVVEWAGVLGLAERKVERVVLQLEDGTSHELALRNWPHSPWAWFSYDFHKRPFPDLVLAYDAGDRLLAKMDLGSRIRPACLVDEVCRRNSERWTGPRISAYAGDATYWFDQSLARRTYERVMHDRVLAQILGGHGYWVEEFGPWLTCDWKDRLGAWAKIELPKRGAFEATWPYVELTPRGDDYVQHEGHRRVERIKSLLVVLDRRGRVVTVDPYEPGTLELAFSDDRILTTTTDIGGLWAGQTDCNLPGG